MAQKFSASLLIIFLAGILSAQPSRIELHSMYSQILKTTKYFNVYFPEGYNSDSAYYPSVYLFRGHEREWANPVEDGSRRGTIQTVADSLYKSGKIGRVMLIMPGLGAPATQGDFEYVISELIPYTESRFRIIPFRWKRGMDGFSYGGLSVVSLLYNNAGIFATAGAYDGSFWAFDLSLFNFMPESYWADLRKMDFFHHCATQGGTNRTSVTQFINILKSHGIQNAFDPFDLSSEAYHNWYNADIHMALSLPLHWQKFNSAQKMFPLQMTVNPFLQKVSGTITLQWKGITDSLASLLQYSRDDGKTWKTLQTTPRGIFSVNWNTALVPDGSRYRFRIWSMNDTLFGLWQSPSFVIDNPGNGAPDVELIAPATNQLVSGTIPIRWYAGDPEFDSLSVSVFIQKGTEPWEPLKANLKNTGSYIWDSRLFPNSSSFRIMISCSDGKLSSYDSTGVFTVINKRILLPALQMKHTAGIATPLVQVALIDGAALKNHNYRITFSVGADSIKKYSVYDATASEWKFQNNASLDGETEGPLFDGLRLMIKDFSNIEVDHDSTRWIRGSSNLKAAASIPEFLIDGKTVRGIPYPSDYQLTVTSVIADTSKALFGAAPVMVYYQVRNITENHKTDIVVAELDGNGRFSMYDGIYFLEKDKTGVPFLTWQLFVEGIENPIPPQPGDQFRVYIRKPLTTADVFEFIPALTNVKNEKSIPSQFALHQNYPNPFNPSTVISFSLPVRGKVTINVVDLLGREIAVAAGSVYEPGSHSVVFSPSTFSSGVYFYRMRVTDEDGNRIFFTEAKKLIFLK